MYWNRFKYIANVAFQHLFSCMNILSVWKRRFNDNRRRRWNVNLKYCVIIKVGLQRGRGNLACNLEVLRFGVLGFDSRRGLGIFLFTTASRTSLGPTQPPIQWVPGVLSLGVKRPGVKLTTHLHLVPRSKNEWSYNSTPPIRLHGVVFS
jgi:hypothetical protein